MDRILGFIANSLPRSLQMFYKDPMSLPWSEPHSTTGFRCPLDLFPWVFVQESHVCSQSLFPPAQRVVFLYVDVSFSRHFLLSYGGSVITRPRLPPSSRPVSGSERTPSSVTKEPFLLKTLETVCNIFRQYKHQILSHTLGISRYLILYLILIFDSFPCQTKKIL